MIKYVRLKDCDPEVNPGWMDPEVFAAEVAKTPKDLNRRVKINIGQS
jgi:hypothetical protein